MPDYRGKNHNQAYEKKVALETLSSEAILQRVAPELYDTFLPYFTSETYTVVQRKERLFRLVSKLFDRKGTGIIRVVKKMIRHTDIARTKTLQIYNHKQSKKNYSPLPLPINGFSD